MDLITNRVDQLAGRAGPRALQILAALLWLSNVSWKVPNNFGANGSRCSGLCRFVEAGIDHPVIPGSAWMFEHIIRPNLTAFGWTTVLIESTLAALLLSGTFVRVAGVVGMAQSAGILLSVANAPSEWYWSYFLMIALHLAILVLAPRLSAFSPRAMGLIVAGYGVVVLLTHRSGGFSGDENATFDLFNQRNDFPGDWGRNVFPGSIALGLGLIIIGFAVAFAFAKITPAATRAGGIALIAVSLLILITYRSDGTILGAGSRPTTLAVFAALGLVLVARSSREPITGPHAE